MEESSQISENIFEIDDYHIRFTLPEKWEKETDTQLDLQCTNNNAYFSVFAFYTIDLSEGQNPLDMFQIQNEELFSQRDNVKVVDYEGEISSEDKTIKAELYSAENDGIKNYYYCCLVEFNDCPDTFAWVLFTATPSYMVKNIENFNNIITSAEYVE